MADLDPIPNRDAVIDPKTGIVTRPWLRWLVLLRDAVNKLIGGTFDGDVTIAGALTGVSAVFSGALTALTLTLTGGQIGFPSVQVPSADPNTLDDYEEGLVATLTSPNISYASGALNYQKIGRDVHVTGFVTFPATADANPAAINNLPFTCENTQQARGGCVCYFDNSGTATRMLVLSNSTTVDFRDTAGAAKTNAALTGAQLFFDFKYRAAA